MNDQVNAELLKWIERGGQWIVEQAPALAQEIVLWSVVSGLFRVTLASIMVGACVVYLRKTIKSSTETLKCEKGWCCAILAILATFGTYHVLYGLCTITYAVVAPRLLVIEKLRELV